ncbi:hypothetical protein D3C86_1766600 [compost metagenome]
MRIDVDLDHACAALLGGCSGNLGFARIKNGDDVAQVLVVGFHQPLQLFLELDFLFKTGVILQGVELGELLFKGFLCSAKLGESGQF